MSPDPLTATEELDQTDEAPEGDRSRMSFLEHLDELRRRILYSLYAVIAACAVTFWYWQEMYQYLVSYFVANGGHLMYTRPMAGFMFSLKLVVLSALLVSAPFVFSQLWLFVAPGLYAREKRVVVPFVLFSSILFFIGAWFAHVVAYPMMWKFFASYQWGGIEFRPDLDTTFSFYVKIIVGLGLVFQMPILVFFLARFGIVSAKFLIQKFKYAVLIIFIAAAILTPSPDVVSQTVIAAPMVALYLVSVVVAWIFGKRRDKDD
jgi:sec-independent protein translocase protein TatC